MAGVCTYAAVAPNTSARLALVSSPTLAAKMMVKRAIKPSFKLSVLILYKTTMAPINSNAAKTVLRYEIKAEILLPDAYPTEELVVAL